ncbi:MAG: extracellular solute-binding protein, partial [Deltaproteobacteria bacterium]|nr:extracellular solute-binding protein [Deltaproteobacteria bacterium]
MNVVHFRQVAVLFLILSWLSTASGFAASSSPSLMKAKKEAEAKGFVFETSHDEIVAKAQKEGKLRVLTSMEAGAIPRMADLLKRKYPFIDVHVEEVSGSEAQQRLLLELKAGTATNWDSAEASEDWYNEYPPYLKKFDILGMAEQGVLAIDPRMVDPNNRNIVSMSSTLYSVAYNKRLLSPDKAPNSWEDFLKPEFKGRKFLTDIRPFGMAALVPLMGEEWVRDYAKKIAAQQPIWVRGQSR